jgi:hypothetical protein
LTKFGAQKLLLKAAVSFCQAAAKEKARRQREATEHLATLRKAQESRRKQEEADDKARRAADAQEQASPRAS